MRHELMIYDAVFYAIVLATSFIAGYRLLNVRSLNRMMRINTRHGDIMEEAVKRETGRNLVRFASIQSGDCAVVHRLQLVIYRLEELTLRDLIHSIDPDAIVDVVPMDRENGENDGNTRHSPGKPPRVSKYGNVFYK